MKKLFVTILFFIALLIPYSVKAGTYDEAPTKIVIPALRLALPIHTSKVIFDTWEVHLDGASYGEGTTLPGNIGNTVIFSHARIGMFATLPKIKKGQIIHVFTKNDWFVYKVEDIFVVNPDRVDVLDDHHQYELTMYTCIGADYSQRFIVKAKLLSNPSYLN